VLVGFMG
jgi:hypothetical protein